MDWSDPASSVVPSLDAAVLSVLAGTTQPLTGREVARLARRGSKTGVQKVLIRLEQHGLVIASEAGPARLYVLNRDHVATPAVMALQGLRPRMFALLREALGEWDPAPVAAAVFGSAARGDGDADSDVDVLLVRPEGVSDDDGHWSTQVDELSQSIRRWSGNPASILQVTSSDLSDMVARGAPVAESLSREAVDLTDTRVSTLLPA